MSENIFTLVKENKSSLRSVLEKGQSIIAGLVMAKEWEIRSQAIRITQMESFWG